MKIPLENHATIAVVGGGPAGSFFAIQILRKAKSAGKTISVTVFEKKREIQFQDQAQIISYREGCNYGAGGLSPRLVDIMENSDLNIPTEIIQTKVESLSVHGEWKNIELQIPEGRKMWSVFRGTRPQSRVDRHVNFDAFLLAKAEELGARIITGQVRGITYSKENRPVLLYAVFEDHKPTIKSVTVEFVVFAAGVNNSFNRDINQDPLVLALKKVVPGFQPPRVRKSLICELQVTEDHLRPLKGEVHFAEFGSKELKIEMSSLIPKNECITVTILGKSVDLATPVENFKIMNEFLSLPHIRRLLPKNLNPNPICLCGPSMILKSAEQPYGHRIAIIGDLATSRLYKDGIYSSYLTASRLAEVILNIGIDRDSLKSGYAPLLKKFRQDNNYGRFVFFLNRITFGKPVLSRILYQAVLTEIRKKPKELRRLDNILWNIASGDDDYKRIFLSMFHPRTILSIFIGGFLFTLRNTIAELIFDLKWQGFGRFPTGIYKELFEEKRIKILSILQTNHPARLEFESMYSIKIKADKKKVFDQLGKFGDQERNYFKPRFITVLRTEGDSNQLGSVVQYRVVSQRFSFNIELEGVIQDRYLFYRVRDGFARGGVLVFQLEDLKSSVCLLSIYVGFNFKSGSNPFSQVFWRCFRLLFPGFLHDVVWNHSLCKLKDVVEHED